MDEKDRIYYALKQIIDPELGVNIVDLGLVYKVDFVPGNSITVSMTLTSPGCPMGESIVNGVKNILSEEFPVGEVIVDLVWQPRWTPEMISEDGLALLG